jgi:hypothetical protein
MNRLSSAIGWFYSQLLRLYPPHFRAEFADEMSAVFAQSIQESAGILALVSLCIGEVRDLPFNLLREHIRERRKNALSQGMEVVLMHPFQPRPLFRSCVTASLVMFSLYCLIVIRPVLALNLDASSVEAVYSGELNVYYYVAEGFFQYRPLAPEDEGTLQGFLQRDTWQAVIMALLGKLTLVSAPIAAVFLGGILLFTLTKNWRSLQRWQRFMGSASMVANIGLMLFLFLPVGHLVLRWWG